MTKIISVHSFRHGTGKSTIIANLATILAQQGKQVAVIDTDFQTPTIHSIFKLNDVQIQYWFNDYLNKKCTIQQISYPIIPNPKNNGQIYVIPAKSDTSISKTLNQLYKSNRLGDSIEDVLTTLDLDIVLIDLYSGLQEETIFTINISDNLLVVLRPDLQDYQGSSVIVEVARRLDIGPQLMLVLNEVPTQFDLADVKTELMIKYDCETVFALPHVKQFALTQTDDIFVKQHPNHHLTTLLTEIATRLAL
ncbi:MinD/ParA family protein [Anaerolineales bacterium HSG6]|nr:MinD/ParA family protein [Anaerolineales bacterium HSG6]MDM8531504.1 MinD/ParA family protein [Anaerolineales bacterium HSG25]